jgi:hypothetical protein
VKKILLTGILAAFLLGCAENPQVTFRNSTSGTQLVEIIFRGETHFLRSAGDSITFEVQEPGKYYFAGTGSSSIYSKIDTTCQGYLNVREGSQILVVYHIDFADDDSTGTRFKLWATVSDRLPGLAVTGPE